MSFEKTKTKIKMKKFFFYVNPDDIRNNIYKNRVLKSIVIYFLKSLGPLLINKSFKVTVLLKVHDKTNLKPKFYKEIKVHECVLDKSSIPEFYLDLERKLHAYPNFKVYWKEVNYIAFEYIINE